MFMRAWFNTEADIGTLLVPTLIQGAALATFFVPLLALGLSGLAAGAHPGGLGAHELRAHHARALSRPRSPPLSGTGARRCITRSWWST